MKSNKGFSLVELIVVIAIMAIIAGVAIPVYTNYIDKANLAVDQNVYDEAVYAAKLAVLEPQYAGVTITVSAAKGKLTIAATGETNAEKAAEQVASIVKATDKDGDKTYELTLKVSSDEALTESFTAPEA